MRAEAHVALSLSFRRMRVVPLFGVLLAAGVAQPVVAFAQEVEEDPVALQKITEMNKKALDAYDALDFEQARKILKDALDACTAANLDKHPIKARTHIHMGAVLFGGFKQRDLAVKQFKKALEIEPDIKLTKSVATPEVQAIFEEAKASMGTPEAGAGGNEGGATEPSAGGQGAGNSATVGLSHSPITVSRRGQSINVVATLDPRTEGVAKVVLAYRPEGATDFLAREMSKSGNTYAGEIPGSATNGATVAYFIEAQGADEAVLSSAGTQEKPFTVSLSAPSGKSGGKKKEGDEEDDDEEAGKIYLSLGVGLGFGSASGNGEVLTRQSASGFASGGGQVVLEGGYFVAPQLRLSLAARFQFYSGPNGYFDSTMSGACGSDNYCQPASGALSVFAKGAWFFRSMGLVRPYVGAALGGGQIRHVVSFDDPKTCGNAGTEACKDTALAGPVFIGPHGGILFAFNRHAGVALELGTQLGFPKFTFNIDVNGNVAIMF